ncbi:MAG: response regulator [Nitrospiraceae bacterium]|jgi:DNA-binding response OmpR family regulator|nr:response regulator [Nitrospiraceae bacterium]
MTDMPKVLIVEDEPLIRLLLEQTLEGFEDHGVEVLTVDNGLDAVEMIRAERPALVLLDVMMPKMNGFEVCSFVKQQLHMNDVYIIMLTSKGQEQDKLKAIEAGTDEYITKPFSIQEVADRVAAALKIRI